MRRVSWALTRSVSSSRVVQGKVVNGVSRFRGKTCLTGTSGQHSNKCHCYGLPSRSSSVASGSSSAFFLTGTYRPSFSSRHQPCNKAPNVIRSTANLEYPVFSFFRQGAKSRYVSLRLRRQSLPKRLMVRAFAGDLTITSLRFLPPRASFNAGDFGCFPRQHTTNHRQCKPASAQRLSSLRPLAQL